MSRLACLTCTRSGPSTCLYRPPIAIPSTALPPFSPLWRACRRPPSPMVTSSCGQGWWLCGACCCMARCASIMDALDTVGTPFRSLVGGEETRRVSGKHHPLETSNVAAHTKWISHLRVIESRQVLLSKGRKEVRDGASSEQGLQHHVNSGGCLPDAQSRGRPASQASAPLLGPVAGDIHQVC